MPSHIANKFNGDIKSLPLRFYIYNTEQRKIVEFRSIIPGKVKMYSCGPTVYDYAHLGHARTYTMTDILIRVLQFLGYEVFQVMNITDVGHLTTDDDWGEDKMLKGLRKAKQEQGKDFTIWDLIEFYTSDFLKMLELLNIRKPQKMPRATQHVNDMIKIIEILLQRGYAYKTDQAVYFDVLKFNDYTRLFPQALDEKVVGARDEVKVDPKKKHPADFRLWQLDQPNHILQWDTPWGRGFPGWHIECSAMSMKYLGPTFDIHTGGEDHIFPHHTNELAQSEAATGERFVNYWVHMYHLMVDGRKMSKSLGNYYRLQDLIDQGFSPEQVRYLFLGTHYRKRLNFTLKALKQAAAAYNKLVQHYQQARAEYVFRLLQDKLQSDLFHRVDMDFLFDNETITVKDILAQAQKFDVVKEFEPFINEFVEYIAYDVRVPQALSLIWRFLRSDSSVPSKLLAFALVVHVFGLRIVPQYTPLEDLLLLLAESESGYNTLEVRNDLLWLLDSLKRIGQFKQAQAWDRVDALKREITERFMSTVQKRQENSQLRGNKLVLRLIDKDNITLPIYVRE